MTPKLISAADSAAVRIVLITMDPHLASAADRSRRTLRRDIPLLTLQLHAAAEWSADPVALQRCLDDIANADIVIATMLFLEEHFLAVLPALQARRAQCDAIVCAMCAGEVTKLTRLGGFDMSAPPSGPMALLKRLRGSKSGGNAAGARQMKMLRRLPKILRLIPGTAQDVRAYFLCLQYWLAGSEGNLTNLVRLLIERYADGPRRYLRGTTKAAAPVDYPEVGLYHPRLPERVTEHLASLPACKAGAGVVGLLVLRSYVLAGNSAHYDGVIAALEARGLRVIVAFASGLDSRPAIEKFFMQGGVSSIDALVSLTGFSLVGGPAYNDASAAADILAKLDVPYLVAHPVEFQTLEAWQNSDRGLLPVESTIMIAIPELDGATGPIVFGGRSAATAAAGDKRDMQAHQERVEVLAARVVKLIALRRTERARRKISLVIFNFPPNAGNSGTAAYLAVFESLFHTLESLRRAGYTVDMPGNVDDLRDRIISGNAERHGAHANVHARISVDTHVRGERWLREIESQWGCAPGKQQSDDRSIFILGERFGNVFVGVQPSFGYEGDPMRLLFDRGFAPTHAFSAFYRWIREDFGAHAVLHFGTHGALEFMPGKQAGMSGTCWPDRLIGDLPNFYLYAANNPSEGTIAKRRAAATLISYLTPPIAHAGLYRGLIELKSSLERWRNLPPESSEFAELAILLQAQAVAVDLAVSEPRWTYDAPAVISRLAAQILELEYTLIPHGLHVVGEPPSRDARIDMLMAVADSQHGTSLDRSIAAALIDEKSIDAALKATPAASRTEATAVMYRELQVTGRLLGEDHEIPALIAALDGRFIRPAPGGDVLRTPAMLPTGRNLHGFDPFRIPSSFALQDGARQAARLLEVHMAEGHCFPESIAMVLWGTDNLKTEGGPIAQALALMGAQPRFDSYGRLCGATLTPLEQLGRPRIDVIITLSGIFRDLLPLQVKLLAEAAYLAAAAEESPDNNYIRKHALLYQAAHHCDLETAALRVFGNADGAYGSNVNHLVENGRWQDEDELAETYTRRKSFAFGRSGRPAQQPELLNSILADVALAYQNLDSVEVGVTTVDHYFDTLGGISRAVRRAKGGTAAPVYIGDQTCGEGAVRTLADQVALETRTRMLNPKWYEGMLQHGYEGVRQIEAHVTNTMGWSATTGAVAPWVYKQLTQTFVLDPQMRERLAKLNPTASAKVANRLLEAHERHYWQPDAEMLESLRQAGEELEDRLEGVYQEVAA